MALKVYDLLEQVEHIEEPHRTRYGWLLINGFDVQKRKIGFRKETDRERYVESIRKLLSVFVDTADLDVRAIAALLFQFDDDCRYSYHYLESLLDEHEDMDCNKSEAIHNIARVLSCEDNISKRDYDPTLLLCLELQKVTDAKA